ncbi:AmmeMemoRadiSam system protein B [Plebeiibacterium sediminum]|uniref:MEMO1 family protein OM075_13010 n=1 Tax=Plebeiibacterium sediminum TaxID=2992112 RepID=A0AAE3M5Q7_9BACT|nr:AmmeMemoRadiSam system protein B [Plebeiobacterium sediminum]MCW3787392.1 AmmeMemoRadiSam system protein B [Plebeiobacterium sediminum]
MNCVDREPVVAGSFYDSNSNNLKSQLNELFSDFKETKENISALIVPHAGYVYSGKIAARAYAMLNPDTDYENIFIIGSSHHVSLYGASIYNLGHYKTPLGLVPVNLNLANKIIQSSKYFEYNRGAHADEHTLEVQLPFLQYQLKSIKQIVPIIVGTHNPDILKEIAKILQPYFNSSNLFVISTDLSHYPTDKNARIVDARTVDAICSNQTQKLMQVLEENKELNILNLYTSLCGWSSVLTLMYLTQGNDNISYEKVLYGNSGEVMSHDTSRVVGYQSIVVTRNEQKSMEEISEKHKKQLLKEARSAIVDYIDHDDDLDSHETPQELLNFNSAFVSVYVSGDLRGCIGQFDADIGLVDLVRRNAVSAAFDDNRFLPVEVEELDDLNIEISVLTPKKKITNIDEIVLGKHGVFIQKGWNRGTFLPQVAEKTNWNIEDFMGHLARDKAHIGWDGWKDADIFIFEAIIFSE